MKKIYTLLLSCLLCLTAYAQENYKMVIQKNDGTQITIPTQEITKISFQDENQSFTLKVAMPKGLKQATPNHLSATFTNTATQQKFILNTFTLQQNFYEGTLKLPKGNYNIEVNGNVNYHINTLVTQTAVQGQQKDISVNDNTSAAIVLKTYNPAQGLVISEIYFTGSETPEKKQYSDDQYVIITNNSDHVIYADSVAFLESQFLTIKKEEYTPDLMKDAFIVGAVYMIPGKGKDHPLQPGQSLLLAINARDHRVACSTSFDLSHADFEFYDETTNPRFTDTDNENVPNLDKWYCYTKTFFLLHNRGFKSYAIAKLSGTKDNFLQNYVYNATYLFKYKDFVKTMPVKAMTIPNTWIVDAVNLSSIQEHQWNVTSPTLDSGFTYVSLMDHDKTRYGLSVIRKKGNDGKYIDTNNSTNDFLPRQKASLRTK